MKIEVLNKTYIQEAASIIDELGIPKKFVWSQYFVIVNDKEYQFKYLIRLAYQLATNKELDFKSNDLARKHIEDLGYEFKYYVGGYNFFTKDELAFYSSIVNTDYRTINPDQKYY